MLPPILSERQAETWRAEKRQIEHLLTALAGWEARQDDLDVLRRALAQLDELFLLVVVGEFNSGKSAFILSSRLALRAKPDGAAGPALWGQSRFAAFEEYVLETLNEESRVRLKLLNPLGVAEKTATAYVDWVEERLGLLGEDLNTLDALEGQITLYQKDTTAEFAHRLTKIDNLLLRMRVRGEEFFDETLRLRRIMDLLNSRRLQEDFAERVVGATPQQIEGQVGEIIDWMMERELRQWRVLSQELSKRQRTESLRDAAEVAATGFEYNRRALLDSVGQSARQAVGRYDTSVEARKLAEGVQDALAQVALVEVGAVGLGVLLKALLVSATADVTGVLAAGVVGVLGFAIIPFKRGRAKRDLREKINRLRDQLDCILREALSAEIEHSAGRLREALAPYGQFVRAEHTRLQDLQAEFKDTLAELQSLRAQIEGWPHRRRG